MNMIYDVSRLKLILCIVFLFPFSCTVIADSTSIQDDLQAAEQHKDLGDFYKASYYYQLALSKDEDNTVALFSLADIAYKRRQYQVAVALLDKILLIDSYEIDALFLRGKIYSLLRQWQEALHDLELAEQIDSDNPEIQIALDQVYSATGNNVKAKQVTKNYKRLNAQAVQGNKQVIK